MAIEFTIKDVKRNRVLPFQIVYNKREIYVILVKMDYQLGGDKRSCVKGSGGSSLSAAPFGAAGGAAGAAGAAAGGGAHGGAHGAAAAGASTWWG